MPTAASIDARWPKPDANTLRQKLTPLQFDVTQNAGTEPSFYNAYWDQHEAGLYVDIVTGEPLFSSADKFDSGTGWPSFTRPVEPERVVTETDRSFGMARVEALSASGATHLGHVFPDGPREQGGLRYCINSASLRFVPYGEMDAAGYGAWKEKVKTGEAPIGTNTDNACATTPDAAAGALYGQEVSSAAPPDPETPSCATTYETAILAGGCFWGMEDLLRDIPGVIDTQVGYTGGTTPTPTYEHVKTGRTGHAESVRVVFDPNKLRYSDLLAKWFFQMHDPTTVNQQGNDVGTQYRSVIFTTTPEQARVAVEVKAQVGKAGLWRKPIVTEILPAGPWTDAEGYHQDYLETFPQGYTCHYMRTTPQ